jgi:hypothetical protein
VEVEMTVTKTPQKVRHQKVQANKNFIKGTLRTTCKFPQKLHNRYAEKNYKLQAHDQFKRIKMKSGYDYPTWTKQSTMHMKYTGGTEILSHGGSRYVIEAHIQVGQSYDIKFFFPTEAANM